MKTLKWIDIVYIILLGITLGTVLTLGAFVAPVIFQSQEYIGKEILTHYQEGLLMSAIFIKSNYLLNFTALAIIVRESFDFKLFKRDKIVLAAASTAVFAAFMFTLYYTDNIIAYQAAGEEMTRSIAFENLHKGSEIDFALLAISLTILLARRVQIFSKGN